MIIELVAFKSLSPWHPIGWLLLSAASSRFGIGVQTVAADGISSGTINVDRSARVLMPSVGGRDPRSDNRDIHASRTCRSSK
jgi:hypothetical protein